MAMDLKTVTNKFTDPNMSNIYGFRRFKKGVPYETHLACEVQSLKFSSLFLGGGGGCDFKVDIVDM